MVYPQNWKDFELLDAGEGEKLERWGKTILRRPDPQAIWYKSDSMKKEWENPTYHYIRANTGGGTWTRNLKPIDLSDITNWKINYNEFTFNIQPTQFKHTGLFPEQAYNWDKVSQYKADEVLNLFAYTGGATVATLSTGANVTHVDASGGMIGIAKLNVELSKLDHTKARFIKEDVSKFVEREIRREKKYDAIILDPPAYGRGANGELWEIENSLIVLLEKCWKLLSDNPKYILINLYANEFSLNSFMNQIYQLADKNQTKIQLDSYELGLQMSSNQLVLPCGGSIFVTFS